MIQCNLYCLCVGQNVFLARIFVNIKCTRKYLGNRSVIGISPLHSNQIKYFSKNGSNGFDNSIVKVGLWVLYDYYTHSLEICIFCKFLPLPTFGLIRTKHKFWPTPPPPHHKISLSCLKNKRLQRFKPF